MSEDSKVRCTDEKLFQLCEKFDLHVERFDEHEAHEEAKFLRLIEAQQNNTQAISELTTQVSALVTDTRDIVQLHKDLQGAARVGSGIQRFILWCMKWGGIIGGLGAALHYLVEQFSKHPPT